MSNFRFCVVTFVCKPKQVYAVEFTDMANHARRLVAKNGMEDVVEVIQCSVEDLKLDAKVPAAQPGIVSVSQGWKGACMCWEQEAGREASV